MPGTNFVKRTAFYQLLVVLQCRQLGDGSAGLILIGLQKAVFERVQRLECFARSELVWINVDQRLNGAFVFRFRRERDPTEAVRRASIGSSGGSSQLRDRFAPIALNGLLQC